MRQWFGENFLISLTLIPPCPLPRICGLLIVGIFHSVAAARLSENNDLRITNIFSSGKLFTGFKSVQSELFPIGFELTDIIDMECTTSTTCCPDNEIPHHLAFTGHWGVQMLRFL